MNEAGVSCWRCGAALAEDLFPLRREEVCPACDADLHVCKICRFYNPSVSDGCDEPVAVPVSNKERANFCDYLEPAVGVHRAPGGGAQARARAELEALFGDAASAGEAAATDPRAELDRLFGLDRK